jgi:hypothetical protein
MRRVFMHPWGPAVFAAVLGAVYLLWSPRSADMAAHAFRSWLWEQDGFAVWNAQWYGGHHVLGYSLLFSPLAAVFGAGLVGVVAGVASTALFGSAVRRRVSRAAAAAAASWLFATAVMSHVVIGRMPFTLGLAFGIGAWLCADRARLVPAGGLALLSVWSSPVAGCFLALAAAARWLHGERAPAVALAAPAVVGGAVLAMLFPEGGSDRFVASAFWPMLALSVAVLALIDPRRSALRFGVLLYLALLIASFAIPNPLGQNTLRYGVTLGPPLLILAARPPSALALRAGLVGVIAALLYLQWLPAIRAVSEARGDPSVRAAFHAEALRLLDRSVSPGERVEVPLTRNHWEAAYLAPHIPLARGWERQLDRKVNPIFYERRLTPRRYQRWLRRTGVRWVALPYAPLDVTAKAEARLLRRGLPYLKPVYRSGHWTIWRVTGMPPPPRLTRTGPEGFELPAARPGTVRVPERHTQYWTVVRGDACVRPTDDGFTEVLVRRAGTVRVQARMSLSGALRRSSHCERGG